MSPANLDTTLQSVVASCWVGLGQGGAAWIGGLLLHHCSAATWSLKSKLRRLRTT